MTIASFPPLWVRFVAVKRPGNFSHAIVPSFQVVMAGNDYCPLCCNDIEEGILIGRVRFSIGPAIYRCAVVLCPHCQQPVYHRPVAKQLHPGPGADVRILSFKFVHEED